MSLNQKTATSPAPAEHKSQFSTILPLFLVLRLTILFLFTPQGLLNVYTDFTHYFRTAQLSEQGFFPFLNMWYEYPPLSAYLVQLTYSIASGFFPLGEVNSLGYQIWARMFGVILLVFDTGVLILTYEITRKIRGVEKADWIGWVYALLSVPVFFSNASHNVIMVFFSLLAIERYLSNHKSQSAVALGLGIAAKLTPLFLLAPVAKFLWDEGLKGVKQFLAYGVIAMATAFAFYLPFLALGGGPWVAASFTALGKVGSWSTVWSLLDGNWGPGDYGHLTNRLELIQAGISRANPPLIPEVFRTGAFAILFGWLFLKPLKNLLPEKFVWFATMTCMLFHIWSKGWSPQWATLIIPFLLLSFPDQRGLRAVLWLTGFTFLEWPVSSAFDNRFLYFVSILGRTTVLCLAALWAARNLWGKPDSQLEPVVSSPNN
ncbi:MAG: hypothetical protein JSV61_10015 [Anaerolineales bacterium]|nr:MAG: hypothetical protein JSV61_10015 [Anaerolineales bacterium]